MASTFIIEDATRPAAPQRNPVSWRSILVGLAGVCFICGLTAFNDYVVGNTYMIGNFLPVGLVMLLLIFIFGVNAPLWKWAPRLALSRGEMAVAMGMALVSCALPSSGLMRYLPAHLVAYNQQAANDPAVANYLDGLHLPNWMFPHFQHKSSALRGDEPVITNYVGRVAVDPAHDNFWGHFYAVPWRLWAAPAFAWGIFLTGLYGMLLCICIIVRRQWVDHERLAFPLAAVYLALIDQPEPGRAVNALFRARGFWIAFIAVFFIHFMNGMNVYYARIWPRIPVNYDLSDILNTQFWSYSSVWILRRGTIYFCIVGICYFLQTKIAFSLWFSVIAINFIKMFIGQANVEYTPGMRTDEVFGACLPFVLTFLWVGRAHWMAVFKQMFRRPRASEPTGRYLPYFLAGWGVIVCGAIMILWLMAVGASLAGSIVLVLMMVTALMIMARVVAETGLIFVQIGLPMTRPWIYLAQNLPGGAIARTTQQSYFMTVVAQNFFAGDMRECLPVFITNALRVGDTAAYEKENNWRKAIPFTLVLILALVVGYFAAGAGMLYTEYTYAQTLDKNRDGPINPHAVLYSSKDALDQAQLYVPPKVGPQETHNRLAHFTGGAVVMTILSVLRLRYVSWPLHPVGVLLCSSWTMGVCWQSIFLGWLAKVMVVRFGGRRGFQSARNFFIGLIVGEAAAAAFWLLVSLARLEMGLPYNAINLLPA